MVELRSNSVESTIVIGSALSQMAQGDDMFVLVGDLGAGKTHFSKGFAAGMGVEDDITSPTFNIVLEYEGSSNLLLHFDLYRLDDELELENIDWYGLTESGAVSLVEWGDKFPAALPDDYLLIDIRVNDDGSRLLKVSGVGSRGLALEQAAAELQ